MTRTQRSLLNYLSGVVYTTVTVAVALVSVPLLLRCLGEQRFGAYRAASDWTAYLSLLDLGLGGALMPLMIRAVGRGDFDAVRATLAAGIRAYCGVVLAMLAGGIGLALLITRLVPVSVPLAADLQRGMWLSMLGTLLLPLAPFRSLVVADHRNYVLNFLLLIQSLLITSLALLLAWQDWGITGQFLAAALGGVPFLLIVAWYAGRRCPGLLTYLTNRSRHAEVRRELWQLNWPTLLQNLCGRVSLWTDNIVIAFVGGPALVVPFFLTQRLAVLAQGQLQGIANSSWAALVHLHVQGQTDLFNRRLSELTTVVAILGMTVLIPIAAYNPAFMHLWVGGSLFGGDLITVLAAVNGLLLAIFTLWGWVLSGTGQARRTLPFSIAAAVINLTASIGLTLQFGLVGPLLGTLLALVSVDLWCRPLLLHRLFGTSRRQLLKSVALPVVVGLPYAAGVWWFARSHEVAGWLVLATEMTVAALVYLILAWFLVFTSSQRAEWRWRLRAFFHRESVP